MPSRLSAIFIRSSKEQEAKAEEAANHQILSLSTAKPNHFRQTTQTVVMLRHLTTQLGSPV
jgi:hypothetical protein